VTRRYGELEGVGAEVWLDKEAGRGYAKKTSPAIAGHYNHTQPKPTQASLTFKFQRSRQQNHLTILLHAHRQDPPTRFRAQSFFRPTKPRLILYFTLLYWRNAGWTQEDGYYLNL
jgi:hypothetical protein